MPHPYTLNDELLDAVFVRDKGQVRHLLAAGANPDTCNEDRCTALMMATVEGDSEIAHDLLEAGADPNLVDGDGWTALDVAVYRRSLDLVWLLHKYGASPGEQADTGSKVLLRALVGQPSSAVRVLPGWGTVGNLPAPHFRAPLDQPKPKVVN